MECSHIWGGAKDDHRLGSAAQAKVKEASIFHQMGIMRVRLSLGDTVYVSEEKDHGIIEQFVPYGKIIVRLVKKGTVMKLSRGEVKKSRQ